jgi:iron(III) transport system substrate-binding protein
MKQFFLIALVACIPFVSSCSNKSSKPKITIYTSTFKEVIDLYKKELDKTFPEIEIEWYQAGSEAVASRVLAEQSGGGVKADLIMTSDIFFFQEQKKLGSFAQISAPRLKDLNPALVDADKMFAVTRFPVMVLAVNTRKVSPAERPKSFKDLANPKYQDKITMPSPLESGTALYSSIFLYNNLSESFFKSLRQNNVIAAGGNGAALSRIQSGERPIGIVLMENVLQAREKGSDWIEYIVPAEGALSIPSPLAIFKSSKHPDIANQVYDWFLSPTAQSIITATGVYGAYPTDPAPKGAPSWQELKQVNWNLTLVSEWAGQRQKVKDAFQEIVLK